MPARLHHDLVFGPAPTAWAMITHGIYGSGTNWRGIARQLAARRPTWGLVLVDLRHHGRSDPGEPPHTVAACADDLAALAAELTAAGRPVAAAIGHSFGGKVALSLRARLHLAQTWVLDATPGPHPDGWDTPHNSVRDVWDSMRALARPWPRRDDFIAAMVARGHEPSLAQWAAMNLDLDDDGCYQLRLDLVAVRELMLDYYAADLWPVVEDRSLPGDVHVVIASHSTALSAADRLRLAAHPPGAHVHAHTIDAGHWLHVDAPSAVVDLLAAQLP